MMPPKLLIVTTVPETLATILVGQPRFLARTFSVQLATSPDRVCGAIRQNEGVPVHLVHMVRGIAPLADLRALLTMIRLLRRIKPDVVHSYTPKAGLIAMCAARFCGVPTRVHTFTGLIFPSQTGLKRGLLICADRLICHCANTIIPEGQGVKKDLKRFGITEKPLNVIGHGNIAGVDTAHFSTQAQGVKQNSHELAQRLKITNDTFVFCFVGRLNRDKGVTELLQAFTNLPDHAHLLLIGALDNTAPISDDSKTVIHAHTRIHELGFLADIRPALMLAKVLVLPSYREGFPNSVLQAGAMCLPVIATDINGSNEIIEPGQNGWLVPPRAYAPLRDAMLLAMRTAPAELGEMGLQARKRVVERFEQNEHWQRMSSFYQDAINQAKKRRARSRKSMAKRLLDVTGSAMALLLLCPIMLAIALLIRCKLGSPVLFVQQRPGLDGRPFKMRKFRTMLDESDKQNGPRPDAERLTSLGRVLRASSLDELPELWNVLNGDMSLVGPRPLLMEYLPLYNQEQRRRHHVRPGITGWAQIHGRNAISWPDKFKLDVWYVDHQTFWLDLKILVLTIKKVLIRDGISAAGDATMPRFTGPPDTPQN